jgi:hypothetical protein
MSPNRGGLRTLVTLALAGHLAGALGVPLPRRVDADGSTHPCDNRVCGCSAEARTAGACCCSVGEGPPAIKSAPDGCCSAEPATKDCCTTHRTSEPSVRWLAAVAARQCRGDGPLGLMTLPPALPAAGAPSWHVSQPASHSVAVLNLLSVVQFRPPPVPPPRA